MVYFRLGYKAHSIIILSSGSFLTTSTFFFGFTKVTNSRRLLYSSLKIIYLTLGIIYFGLFYKLQRVEKQRNGNIYKLQ